MVTKESMVSASIETSVPLMPMTVKLVRTVLILMDHSLVLANQVFELSILNALISMSVITRVRVTVLSRYVSTILAVTFVNALMAMNQFRAPAKT